MNLEEQFTVYKKMTQAVPQEEKIQETICKSKEAFFASEREGVLSYHEFLWAQFKVMQKRWWVLQFLVLLSLWAALVHGQEDKYIQRGMGVMASLFVILIIPELWKNRSNQSMEIEAVSYYSLRQIYAARMLLFGIADILLVAVFCGSVSVGPYFEWKGLIVQFLFPLSVTACICFGALCSKHCVSETVAVALCIVWSALWLFVVLNEGIYTKAAFPIWLCLLGLAFTCLAALVRRTLICCNNYWEVSLNGSEIS